MAALHSSLDPITTIAGDTRVSSTAVRLYLLLHDGRSLDEAAGVLGKNPMWLQRYQRQLINLGYLVIIDERTAKGRTRRYVFPTPK